MLDNPRNDTVLETLAFTAVGELLVLCHSKAHPSDAEWTTWVERERRREHKAILISTDGGAPNSRQRARVAESTPYASGRRPPVALLTDSAVARHVMTAFAWILGNSHSMRVFPRGDVADAVAWLGATSSLDHLRAAIERLHATLANQPRSVAH
jgi:hypothetical protein